MSLFKSKRGRRNIRKKATEEDEEEGEGTAEKTTVAGAVNGETQSSSAAPQTK